MWLRIPADVLLKQRTDGTNQILFIVSESVKHKPQIQLQNVPSKTLNTDLTQQLGQPHHLSCEHAQADEDGVELANGTSYVSWRNLSQVHRKHTESYTYQE